MDIRMKAELHTLVAVGAAFAMFACTLQAQTDNSKDEYYERLHQRWHEAIARNPIASGPSAYRTETPGEVGASFEEIWKNRFAFGYFLAERIAHSDGVIGYSDALLLERTAGIDLIRSDEKPFAEQNFGENLRRQGEQFRKEWREGIYRDPCFKLSGYLEGRGKDKKNEGMNALELAPIRRYGVFALPCLVEAVKKRNSSHAFAAYLIITGNSEEYANYLDGTETRFATPEAKLHRMRAELDKLKSGDAESRELLQKIHASFQR